MSAQSSNLSAYGYDLVSAVSQDALNASMKAYVGQLGGKVTTPITAYYVKQTDPVTKETKVVLLTPNAVQTLTGGYDIFSIPNNATNDDAEYKDIIIKLATAGFAYAFEVTVGLPPEVPPLDLPDMLFLDQYDPQTVTYHTYYKTFKIVELSYISFGLAQVTQLSQDTFGPDTNGDGVPDKDPWVFGWEVKLDLSAPTTTTFNSLSPDVQKSLIDMQINPSMMFSMQTLYLDLNSPRLVNGATTSTFNFLATDPIYATLNEFIDNYWIILKNEFGGNLVLGSSLKPGATSDYPPSSIMPTAVTFVVSPNSGGTTGLNTLNYLIMSDNRPMPTIRPFTWDWVNDDTIQGIMSVRRDLFISYLNAALSPALSKICVKPEVIADYGEEFDINLKHFSANYVQNTANPVLNYATVCESKDKLGIGAVFNCDMRTEINSAVVLSGNTIVVTSTVAVYAHLYTAGATTEGYSMATRSVTTFTMDAVGTHPEDAGILHITANTVNTDLRQSTNKNGSYYTGNINDESMWSHIVTIGNMTEYLDEVNDYTSAVERAFDGYQNQISDICTNCLGWTFPGAGTYTFANPRFSDALDLTVQTAVQGY